MLSQIFATSSGTLLSPPASHIVGGKPRCGRGRFGRVKLNPGGMVSDLLLVRRSKVRAKEGEAES